jgi:hypothetical protein
LDAPKDFFRFAAFKIRLELQTMAAGAARIPRPLGLPNDASSSPLWLDPQTDDPARLAMWTTFHEEVDRLPHKDRPVFKLHYYLGMPQAEVAAVLDLHACKVSRMWNALTVQVGRFLPEGGPSRMA